MWLFDTLEAPAAKELKVGIQSQHSCDKLVARYFMNSLKKSLVIIFKLRPHVTCGSEMSYTKTAVTDRVKDTISPDTGLSLRVYTITAVLSVGLLLVFFFFVVPRICSNCFNTY
jgi:hypothetical protein